MHLVSISETSYLKNYFSFLCQECVGKKHPFSNCFLLRRTNYRLLGFGQPSHLYLHPVKQLEWGFSYASVAHYLELGYSGPSCSLNSNFANCQLTFPFSTFSISKFLSFLNSKLEGPMVLHPSVGLDASTKCLLTSHRPTQNHVICFSLETLK